MHFDKSTFNIFKAGRGHVATKGLGFFTKGLEGASHGVAGALGYGIGPLLGGGLGYWLGAATGIHGVGLLTAGLGAMAGGSLGSWSMRGWSKAFMGSDAGGHAGGFFKGITDLRNDLVGKAAATPFGKSAIKAAGKGIEELDRYQSRNFRVLGMKVFPYKDLPKDDIRRYAPHAGLAVGLGVAKAVFGPGKDFANMVLNNNSAPEATTTYDNLMREITSAQNLNNSLRR